MNMNPRANAYTPLFYSDLGLYNIAVPRIQQFAQPNMALTTQRMNHYDSFTANNSIYANRVHNEQMQACCCRDTMLGMSGMTTNTTNQMSSMPGMNMNEGMSTVGPSSEDFQFGLSDQTKNQLMNYQQGNPLSFSFQLFNKQTNQTQTQFDIDAEKKVHVFLVSKDQKTYKHVHPVISPNGTLQINSQDPKEGFSTKDIGPGDYYLYAQFKPTGSSDDQVLMEPVHLGSADAHTPSSTLTPDTNQIKNIDGYTVQMTNPPTTTDGSDTSMSNMQGMNMPTLTITQNGKPVYLRPYLGMASHATILSQDGTEFEHVHPMLNSNQTLQQNGQTFYQGPIQFHTNISKPGTYTMFSQFLIDNGTTQGKLITVPYTFNVHAKPSSM